MKRTKRIASSLNEEDGRPKIAQYFVTQFERIAAAAERITETDDPRDSFRERDVATNSAAHAFPDQDRRA
jgi:hypothetical protein